MNSNYFSKDQRVLRWGLYTLAVALWGALFFRFYAKGLIIAVDTTEYYSHIKYYLENIFRGVYPMWTPFENWGKPDDFPVRLFGEFNPLLYIAGAVHALGAPFSLIYFLFIVGYSLIGVWGFALLAKRIFNNELLTFCATLLLLFSSFTATVFNDIAIMFLIVPYIWFGYFAVSFGQEPKRSACLGMGLTLAVILTTYFPFYFVTALAVFCLIAGIVYAGQLRGVTRKPLNFIRANKVFFALCVLLVCVFALPGLWAYLDSASGEYVVAWRHSGSNAKSVVGMTDEVSGRGGLVGPYSFYAMFFDQMDIEFGLLYIPLFGFLMLIVSAWSRMSRRALVFLLTGTVLVLIGMTHGTPLYGLLYRYVFYMKYIRNLQYMLWFAFPFFILWAVDMLRSWMDEPLTATSKKWLTQIWVLIGHVGGWIFLSQEPTGWPAQATIVLSFVFFSGLVWGKREQRLLWIFIAFVVIACHPVRAIGILHDNMSQHVFTDHQLPASAHFSWTRPDFKNQKTNDQFIHRHSRDASGFIKKEDGGHKYFGLRSAYELHENLPWPVLQNYVRHKFVAVDHVAPMDPQAPDWRRLAEVLGQNQNTVLIGEEDVPLVSLPQGAGPGQARTLERNTDEFRLVKFDLNGLTIHSNFMESKFLIYNDGFHRDWAGWMDGQRTKIFRANHAFKGLYLPSGQHVVRLTFRSGSRTGILWLLIIISQLGFVGLGVIVLREKSKQCSEGTGD